MKNIIAISLIGLFFISMAIALPVTVSAGTLGSEITGQLGDVGQELDEAGTAGATSLPQRIGIIIRAVLGLLGIVVVIIIIYAGFTWMTAGGDKDKVGEARKWITNAVIGLAIILSAYAITDFVIEKLITSTTG